MESRTVTIDKLELLMDTVEITAESPSDIAVYHDAGAMQLPEARCGATLCVFAFQARSFLRGQKLRLQYSGKRQSRYAFALMLSL